MIDRREFIGALTGGLLAAPLAAEAQQTGKIYRIGFLGTATRSLMSTWLTAFREGLRERGYVEGESVAIEYRWGEGQPERFPGLAAELVKLQVDVIVTSGPQAVRAVQHATNTIPIVMAVIQDPVEMGFVASLARPGGNITGLSFQDSQLVSRCLQLLKEAIPDVSRVAALWDPTGDPAHLRAVETAARSLGLILQILEVRVPEDLAQAFEAAKQKRAQALLQLASPLLAAHRERVLALSAKNRLPAMCQERTFVVDGCLMAYGPSFVEMFKRAAYYVDRILRGAKPADLPVERAATFELAINLKTAKALGLTIPPSLLQRADQVIE